MPINLDMSLADLFKKKSAAAVATAIPAMGWLPIPLWAEPTNFALRGPAGAGKTTVLSWMLETIIARGDGGFCVDPKGTTMERFWRDGDKIFNLFDARSVRWSLFSEIRTRADIPLMAQCIVTDSSGTKNNSDWDDDARTFLEPILEAIWKSGRTNMREILHLCCVATQEELAEKGYLAGTPAEAWLKPENVRYFGSIQGVLAKRLNFLKYDFPNQDQPLFSIRDFVDSLPAHGPNGNFLWFTFPALQRKVLRPLYSIVIGLFFSQMLARKIVPNTRIWASLDELTQLGDINMLSEVAAMGREYGLSLLLGFQNQSQMHEVYGPEKTKSILSNCSTKFIFRPADAETAGVDSASLGFYDEKRWTRGASDSAGQSKSTSDGLTEHHITDAYAVPKGELQELPNLTCYVRIQELPPAMLVVPYHSRKLADPPEFFVPVPEVPEVPDEPEDGAGRPDDGPPMDDFPGEPAGWGIDHDYVDSDGVIHDEPVHFAEVTEDEYHSRDLTDSSDHSPNETPHHHSRDDANSMSF